MTELDGTGLEGSAGDSKVGSGMDEDGNSGGYSPKSARSAVWGRVRFLQFLILCDRRGCSGGD